MQQGAQDTEGGCATQIERESKRVKDIENECCENHASGGAHEQHSGNNL
jgi:hypothetical protein